MIATTSPCTPTSGHTRSIEARRGWWHAAKHKKANQIRHNIGKGVAGVYVIGYALEARWWSYFFERVDKCAPDGAEVWSIEAYNHEGKSWLDRFYYWPNVTRCCYEMPFVYSKA